MRVRTRAALAAIAVLSAAPLPAQQPEPLLDALARAFQQDAFRVGALLQIVGDLQPERTLPGRNGFQVANARLGISGRLDGGWSYQLQTAFTGTPAILDARIGFTAAPWLTVDAGRFKAPFSRERLTSAAGIDFVNRAQVTTTLAPGRQVGAQARGRLSGGRVEYGVGAFNGNGLASGNDNNDLMYVARVSFWPMGDPASAPADRRLEVGVNAATSHDRAAPVGGLVPAYRGGRTLGGVDARLRRGRLLLAGEAIVADLDSTGGGSHTPAGWHATVGWHVNPRSQLLARWDAFRPDGLGLDSDLLVLGWNRWPTRATEIQVNWIIDLNDAALKRHQLLVNLQVGF